MFIYEEGDRIIVEPVPSLEELHGIHAGDHEPGEVLARVQEMKNEEKRNEDKKFERLRPSEE